MQNTMQLVVFQELTMINIAKWYCTEIHFAVYTLQTFYNYCNSNKCIIISRVICSFHKWQNILIINCKNKLEGNCDFSSNNTVWTTFCALFGNHFKYCWVIFIMRDVLEFCLWVFSSHIKLEIRLQISNF